MAVKWAVANGNWNAGATWNDGVVPTIDDDVYCNGYTITCSQNFTFNGIIHNDANEDLSINQGGHLQMSGTAGNANWEIRKLISVANIIYYTFSGSSRLFTLNATIEHYGVENAIWSNSQKTINGDVTLGPNSLLWGFPTNAQYYYNIINGNVFAGSGSFITKWGITESYLIQNCVINGNCAAGVSSKYVLINGNYTPKNSYVFCDEFTLSGNIAYENCGNGGVATGTLNILNPDTFTWKDITEPRTNPFIIVTNYEINNTTNYPAESDVKNAVSYAYGQKVGTYTPDFPQEANVMQGVTYDNGNKTGTLAPVVLGDYPDVDKVLIGTIFDYGNKVGTLEPTADYPAEADVKEGVIYDYGQKEGTLSVSTDYPQEANVLQGVEYAYGSMVGTLEVVQMQADYPSEDDVRFDVVFDFGNKQGKCHVPIPEDVRDGIPVDVNEVGTLIPSSGGDRLRIADFGYYTNAQSDTYIVDITDADKPKFASAEERILIEMFPTLDLDNIPEMYFDDLFVKYLKYRLIVEYYRTAGVNSTFTPSEPTTEIVNYRNVTCEVWLNSANTYLNAWNKKFGLNKPPQKVRL